MAKNWQQVRSKAGNKMLFRYCPETDEIEIKTPLNVIEVVRLDDLRPAHKRRVIQPVDEAKHLCYSSDICVSS